MPVFPYKVKPVAPLMAVLARDGEDALCEDGSRVALDELPKGYRVWGGWDHVTELWGDGHGEALCWRQRPVRWRHRTHTAEEGWVSRHTDVRVLGTDWPETDEAALEGLVAWRDWLAGHGASPMGSMGSTSWSLLRASLDKPLWTGVGEVPPIRYIVGGRQAMPAEVGRYGPVQHYDLPAAYASALGMMRYGGTWRAVGAKYAYQMVAHRGVLCFVRAQVSIPKDLPFGPLPRRPVNPPKRIEAMLSFQASRYPRGKTIQGIWTWEEVAVAESMGCTAKILNVWIHLTRDGYLPFLPWWRMVEEGRALPGFAGKLAKATGNALWGQFCLVPGEERTIDSWRGSRSSPKRQRREAPLPGSSPHYCPDLAETLTGRVRADLFKCMIRAGDEHLLCAHTDGIWSQGTGWNPPEGWRKKQSATRFDMLTPQFIRYHRKETAPAEYIVAGAPATLAPAIFERMWHSFAEKGWVPA